VANFGFILSRSPNAGRNLHTLYNLALAALRKNHKVFIYLCYDGIYSPIKNQRQVDGSKNPREMIGDLIQKGAEVICSELDTRVRGIDGSKTFIEGIKIGNLPDLAEAVSRIDRLITL